MRKLIITQIVRHLYTPAVHCGKPPEIENGYIDPSPTNDVSYNGKVKYSCRTGYGFTGSVDSVTCEANAMWSTKPVCGSKYKLVCTSFQFSHFIYVATLFTC